MFHGLTVGWADLVLPGTAMLERDGTLLNLEGRLQRLRRAAVPPVPDELAWIAKLGRRFGLDISPHAALLFEEVAERCFAGHRDGRGRRAGPARIPRRVRAAAAGDDDGGRRRAGAGRALPR